MMGIDRLAVRYHGAIVGILSMTPDEKLCAFEYDILIKHNLGL